MRRHSSGSVMPTQAIFAVSAILAALSGVVRAAPDEEPLRCYQCRVEKNEDCTDEYLRDCPTDQAYDVCMVSVINNGGHVYIEKKCALGPCDLRDPKQSDGLGLDKCDRSQNSYSCFECCKGSGCNRSPATSTRAPPSITFICLISVLSLLIGVLQAAQTAQLDHALELPTTSFASRLPYATS